MKTKITLVILAVVAASCSSLQEASVYDELYYSPKDEVVASNENMAYTTDNPTYDESFYDKMDRQIEKVLKDSTIQDTILLEKTGNPYEDVLVEDPEKARLMRELAFQSPSYGMNYWPIYYSDAYWYASAYDPAFYNIIVSGGYVWVEPRWVTSSVGYYHIDTYSPYWGLSYGYNFGCSPYYNYYGLPYHGSYYGHYGYSGYYGRYYSYDYAYYNHYYKDNYRRPFGYNQGGLRPRTVGATHSGSFVAGSMATPSTNGHSRSSSVMSRSSKASMSRHSVSSESRSRTTSRSSVASTIRRTDVVDSRSSSSSRSNSRVATRPNNRSSVSSTSRSAVSSRSATSRSSSSYVRPSSNSTRVARNNTSSYSNKSVSTSSRYSRPQGTSTYKPGNKTSSYGRSSGSSSSRSSYGNNSRSSSNTSRSYSSGSSSRSSGSSVRSSTSSSSSSSGSSRSSGSGSRRR